MIQGEPIYPDISNAQTDIAEAEDFADEDSADEDSANGDLVDRDSANGDSIEDISHQTEITACGICAEGLEPQEEICNYLDDDCDCEIDEDWADTLGTPCRGYYLEGDIFLDGYCTDLGEIVCNSIPGHGYVYLRCSTADPISAFTTPAYWDKKDGCDGLDDDCDGLIDEDCVEQD